MKKLERILCVDDESDMRMLIKMSLENVGGYEVSVCSSGQELLDNAARWYADLVVLDAVMPLMDGMETMKRLRLLDGYRDTPVLFMTGKAKESEADFKAAGAIGIITKPFDPIYLAQDVQKIWESAHNG